jgi:NDP-sugar pyrophosphorylase family protein
VTPRTATPSPTVVSPAESGDDSGFHTTSPFGGARATAIVLAGAYHATDDGCFGALPRPLLPVAQIPLIGHVLRWLRDGGITRATICANRWSRAVESCIGDGSDLSMQIDYIEDPEPRGPAGSARDAAVRLSADTVVVVDSTVVPDCDLRAVISGHMVSKPAATAVVHYATRSGINGDRVATPAGIYVFNRKAFDLVPPFGFQDIKEHLLPTLRRQGQRVMAYCSPEFSPRVLNAETYLAVNHWMIERIPTAPDSLAPWRPTEKGGMLAAHPSASIHPTARIIGPAVIGAGVTIGPNAVIVGPTSLGANTRIGAGSLVCRSVIWSGCHVGEQSFVDASVVGDGIVVPPHSTIEGEVRMNRAKQFSWREAFASQSSRREPVPARSLADLAIP